MLQKVNVVVLVLIFVLAGVSFFNCPKRTCSFKNNRGSSNAYPISVDERGRVNDPYLQREVKNTITYNARSIQECYNSFIDRNKNNTSIKTDGSIHVDWMVSGNGRAYDARIVFSNFSDEELGKCVISNIDQWHFPPPGALRYAEHRFSFAKQANDQK